jgi:hypothetical protein
MGWERRGRHRYYYARRKAGGHESRTYLGRGPVAEQTAEADALRQAHKRAERAALREAIARWEKADGPLQTLEDVTEQLARASLEAAGYHQHHRGAWRKRRAKTMTGKGKRLEGLDPEAMERLRQLLGRAEHGDPSSLPEVRRALDASPEVWRRYGDLAAQARASWVRLVAGTNALMEEALSRQLDEREAELGAGTASPLEKLLLSRVVSCWLQVEYADAGHAQLKGVGPAVQEAALRHQESAQRRLLAAAKQLAVVRKLLRPPLSPFEAGLRTFPETPVPSAECRARAYERSR